MIGERYAVAPRVTRPGIGGRPSPGRQWAAISARVSPWRLYQTLGDSPLVRITLAMALLAVASLLYLTQASQVSVFQYNIAYLQAQRVQLTGDNTALRAQAISLQSLARVQHIATTRLHMITPDIRSTLWVSPIYPHLPTVRRLDEDTVAAQQQSQPLYWLKDFVHFVRASL